MMMLTQDSLDGDWAGNPHARIIATLPLATDIHGTGLCYCDTFPARSQATEVGPSDTRETSMKTFPTLLAMSQSLLT